MNLKIVNINSLREKEQEKIFRRSSSEKSVEISKTVERIIKEVRLDGDQALLRHSRQFDCPGLDSITISKDEKEALIKSLDHQIKDALDNSLSRIRLHHQQQIENGGQSEWEVEIEPGVISGERRLPLDNITLYVPSGKGSFPSVAMMLAVPATLAGVKQITVCTPASEFGPDPATLYVLQQLGIKDVYLIGGASAIAAVAFGTETVPKSSKIVGPGNRFVVEAKRQLAHLIDVGPQAGPSEAVIIADAEADPITVCKELLVEAEHGPDSTVLLLTDSQQLANQVSSKIGYFVDQLPELRKGFIKQVFQKESVIVFQDIQQAVDFSNRFAPEHLRMITEKDYYDQITNAGEVIIGTGSSISLANYTVGVNAVLPTSGFARSVSCLGINDFSKRNSVIRVTASGARKMAKDASLLAGYEGFPAHKAAADDLSDQ